MCYIPVTMSSELLVGELFEFPLFSTSTHRYSPLSAVDTPVMTKVAFDSLLTRRHNETGHSVRW